MIHAHSKGVNAVRKSDLSYEDLETKIELQDSKLEYQDQYIEQLQHMDCLSPVQPAMAAAACALPLSLGYVGQLAIPDSFAAA